jgi:hypothetical protein
VLKIYKPHASKRCPAILINLERYLLYLGKAFIFSLNANSERMRPIKGQSAMEYLMTYGWSILIIAVVLGIMFQLGVFSGQSYAPKVQPGSCKVFRPSGPGTNTNLNLMGVCNGLQPQYVANFNGQNSYVDAGNLNTPNSITIAAWVYWKGSGDQYQGIAGKGSWNYPEGRAWDWIIDLSRSSLSFVDSTPNEWPGPPISANTWTYVALTISANTLYFYKNGIQSSLYTVAWTDQSRSMTIGALRRLWAGFSYFNGLISNVQIYNASLDAGQIQALYREGIGGVPIQLQNLMGWWPLNSNANDYSGNNYNGQNNGAAFTSAYSYP